MSTTVKTIVAEITETVDADVMSSPNPRSAKPSEVITNTQIIADDYNVLRNHPSINTVELIGDKSFEELGLQELTNSELEAMLSI